MEKYIEIYFTVNFFLWGVVVANLMSIKVYKPLHNK